MPVRLQSGSRWELSTQTRFPSPLLSPQTLPRFFLPAPMPFIQVACAGCPKAKDARRQGGVAVLGGGAKNPNGSLKKQKMPAGEVVGRKKAARTKRAATKAEVRQRFLRYRGEQERRKQFDGPRTFDAWLLHVASEHLDSTNNADPAPMPQVRSELLCLLSCVCAEVARVPGGGRERCPGDGEEPPSRKISLTGVEKEFCGYRIE